LRKFSESGYGTWYGGDAEKFLFKYELPAPVANSTKNETCQAINMATKALEHADCEMPKEFFCRKMRLIDVPAVMQTEQILLEGEFYRPSSSIVIIVIIVVVIVILVVVIVICLKPKSTQSTVELEKLPV